MYKGFQEKCKIMQYCARADEILIRLFIPKKMSTPPPFFYFYNGGNCYSLIKIKPSTSSFIKIKGTSGRFDFNQTAIVDDLQD